MKEIAVKPKGVYTIQYTSWKEFKMCSPYETSYLNNYTMLWYSFDCNPIQFLFQYTEREFGYTNMMELRIRVDTSDMEEVKRWTCSLLYKQYEEILGAEDGTKIDRAKEGGK